MHGIIFERSTAELGTQPAGMMMMMPGSACDTPQPKRKRVVEPWEFQPGDKLAAEIGQPRYRYIRKVYPDTGNIGTSTVRWVLNILRILHA